jgi:hypothetical protein
MTRDGSDATWSERAYADPAPYLRHGAELVTTLGPPPRAIRPARLRFRFTYLLAASR